MIDDERFRREFLGPIEATIEALTPGLASSGGIGPPVRPIPPRPGWAASGGVGTPVRPTTPPPPPPAPGVAASGGVGTPVRPGTPPPPPPPWDQYAALIQFVDFHTGLIDEASVTATWPDPGPLFKAGSRQTLGTGLLIAAAYLRRNAAREWIHGDAIAGLIGDAAARLSAHGQALLG
jgi:hypothetical protein